MSFPTKCSNTAPALRASTRQFVSSAFSELLRKVYRKCAAYKLRLNRTRYEKEVRMKNLLLVAFLSLATFGCASQHEKCESNSLESSNDAAVVDGHLIAYNKHDVESMLQFFHPEIEAYSSAGELQLKGLESFRVAFAETFKAKPNEVVVARIVQGNRIIDQVDTSFQAGARVVTERDTVVYTIEKGLIRKITFL